MKKKENKKGFQIFEVSINEAYALGWGDICDNCNELLTGTRYFVPVLGRRCLCESCCNEWVKEATVYEEDKPYEKQETEHFLKEAEQSKVKLYE